MITALLTEADARAYLYGGTWLIAFAIILCAPMALMWAAALSKRGRR